MIFQLHIFLVLINNKFSIGINCAPLLFDLFLYGYEAEFIKRLLKVGKEHLAEKFNFAYMPLYYCIIQRFRSLLILSLHVNLNLIIR